MRGGPGLTAAGPSKRLTRDVQGGILGGVCAGWADYLDIDRAVIRVGYVLVSLLSAAFPGILAYIIMWVLIPAREGKVPPQG